MTVSLMYGISFAIACVIFGIILFIQQEKIDSIFTFLYLIIIFVHFGYYSLSTSMNYEEALLAYKLTYLDGTMVPYMVLLCIMEVCGLRRNKIIIGLSVLPITTYLLGLTAGRSGIYYSNIEFHRVDGYAYLTRSYGPLHVIGTICVVVFMLAPLVPVIYAYRHKNTVSYKYTVCCGLLIFINAFAYFIQSVLGISFEILPFQYNLFEILFVYIVYKTSRHDIKRQGYMVKNRMKEYGFLAFDAQNRYLGCDDVALYYFPELEELKIDTPVENKQVAEEFLVWENYFIDDESIFKYFERLDKVLKCRRKPLVIDQKGNENGFIVEVTNDTEHVRHVEELNQMNSELRDAVEEAKRANESKTIFFSRMSHEIRTPINAIIGMNEIILRETKEGRIRPYAKTIASSAKMLLMLINDLLDFSKIESGKMGLVEEEYSEKKMLHDALQMVRQRAISKDLELILETVGELPKTLYGDGLKNQQIIINLLTNAIKYTDAGQVKLTVSAEYGDDDMVRMHYDVSDTGIGIKKEDLNVLFEAFTRVDLKHNNRIEGTGLGLSIISYYVNLMNGQISVESEFGQGSTFSVVIPQKMVSKEKISNLAIEHLDFEEEDVNSSKKLYAPDARVLVVDDNPTNLSVFKLLLNPTEIQITAAGSGTEAIEILERESFDMVFLDHMMPGLDGIQTLQIIRERKLLKNPDAAVVALTANAIANAKEMYLEKGFTDYISKPIDIGRLVEVLATYLPEEKYSFVDAEDEVEASAEERLSAEVEKLPALDEFDFEYAVRHMGSAEGVQTIAAEVYKSIPAAREKLNQYVTDLTTGEAIDRYRIEVHTLKGNAASIGALLLSKTCRLAEVACIEGNVDKVRLLHSILLEELDRHYERLAVFVPESQGEAIGEAQLIDVTEEELTAMLEEIRSALEDWDYDAAEKIANKLMSCRLQGAVKNAVDEIAEEVLNLNGAYAIDLIDEVLSER